MVPPPLPAPVIPNHGGLSKQTLPSNMQDISNDSVQSSGQICVDVESRDVLEKSRCLRRSQVGLEKARMQEYSSAAANRSELCTW